MQTERSIDNEALADLLEATVSRGGSLSFMAKGSSMSPFIRDGDLLTVSPLSGGVPRLGEVVAFRPFSLQRLVIHRVVARRETHCLVKGDNTVEPDGLIPLAAMIGKVSVVERSGRRIRLGLGRECAVIALLSRSGILRKLLLLTSRFMKIVRSAAF